MTTYRLMDGVSGRPGVGSSGTQPPSAPTAYSGGYIAGLVFQVTSTAWFQGYWWWVPPGGDTAAPNCALWEDKQGPSGQVVPGSVVTGGTLTAGQFNFIALPAPLPLSQNVPYVAALGYATTIGFPFTQHQFGPADPYAAGITSGPLSGQGNVSTGSGIGQQPFNTSGSDASTLMPVTQATNASLLWLDVQVTDTAPAGATYRIWPGLPYAPSVYNLFAAGNDHAVIALELTVSQAASITKLWHFSDPAGAVVLPSRATVWNADTQTAVADASSATWSGAAGSGWIYCTNLPAAVLHPGTHYKASTFLGTAGSIWFDAVGNYFVGGGGLPGQNGITQGILTAPNSAGSSPGQGSYNNSGSFVYPGTTNGETYFVDLEVAPVSGSGLLMASFP